MRLEKLLKDECEICSFMHQDGSDLWVGIDSRASFELPIGQCSTMSKLHVVCHAVSIAAQRLSKADAVSCLSLHNW